MNEEVSQFVATLFHAGTITHFQHLQTKEYSVHKALGKFYPKIVDLADGLAESYQGRHGLIGPITLHSAKKTTNVLEFLEDQVKEIEKCRYEVCEKEDTPLQNLIDEILALYFSTLYKLKFLA